MFAEPLEVRTTAVIPLMAALPYAIVADEPEEAGLAYNPATQLGVFAGLLATGGRPHERH